MKFFACLLIMIWICPGVPAAAQLLLPAEMSGWRWDNRIERHDSRTLYGYMDGAAELYLSYGFQDLTVRRFVKPGLPPITVELYRMASSTDAYGVFTFERQDEPASVRFLRSHVLLNQRFFIAHRNILSLDRTTEVVLTPLGKIWTYPVVKGKTRLNILSAFAPQFYGRGANFFDGRYVGPTGG